MDSKTITKSKLIGALATSFTLAYPAISAAATQSVAVNQSQISIPQTSHTIEIDGELNDRAWDDALTIDLNLVNHPWNNKASPVSTKAKMIENGEYLYISFVAQDPNPEAIQASLADRDTTWTDDIVGIKIDPQNNRRSNYAFFVNPYGVQNDHVANEITGDQNTLWDGIWHSYGKITENGYQVEMAIPFHILNFEESNETKYWAFELSRQYPRDNRLRISHIPLDRNNDCWLCQYPVAVGFEDAQIENDLTITPSFVATLNQQRDIYTDNSDWQDNDDYEAGIDLRWGVDANTLVNVTINPDFSTIESDAGQLNVNTTNSLFFDEKRPFFLENSDYFESQLDLVYTRNIATPDYGAKLTGLKDNHTYGAFFVKDTQTNFLMPGNLSDEIASLNDESHSGVLRYRYDYQQSLSVGAISTLRKSDNYHNYVVGMDGKYKFDDNNAITAQLLTSNTEYPDDLFQSFCLDDDCSEIPPSCTFGNCGYSEQVIRANKQGEFSDQAYIVNFKHQSEFWDFKVEHENIGEDFRADLGFISQVDSKTNEVELIRNFYGEDTSLWQEANLSGEWVKKENQNGELISEVYQGTFTVIDGPLQSLFEVLFEYGDRVGLRHDDSILDIDGNTDLFTEKLISGYAEAQFTSGFFLGGGFTFGDKIDYANNRLGDLTEYTASMTWNMTPHLTTSVEYVNRELEHDKQTVFDATLIDTRISYQFDVHSYLRLNLVYQDVDRTPEKYLYQDVNEQVKSLSTQLIYAYKLNPQTVFFLGYSDSSFQDDSLRSLEREQRTFFTKVSYAWR